MDFDSFNLSKNGGLLPAIIQDARSSKVLMLGYMNREAFEKTCSEGVVSFWSRTRNCLWTKGETSGNFLHVKDMYLDCDGDTLLVTVVPDGPVCHRGTTSCFDTPDAEGFIGELAALIQSRHQELPAGSYTTKLFIKGAKTIGKKVCEEAAEAVIEAVDGNRERFVYETGDLLYHLLVLMEEMNVSLADIQQELALRHRKTVPPACE
ncbi:MAG: bifunctional phosphoribosyl-AMP cyclohydrolase/phosphoribosyl-ATP diphosphatase HisIE [Bacteroidales bacterium]|nr:bifunctional phosphoribosyl-AMP cyclohydrolase/phosphoribosyl-ATP diphosphatase HisIE [Bacteroidales bacterium]MBP5520981.1 bifunctional phosphoribosyl-AMP cyclohydrolase/phosphoribosyl-ATP diphosphatase HisIE [Bacteroidales bacterium]